MKYNAVAYLITVL